MKEDKYLLSAVSINFLATFSFIFENVVKILTGRKSDISLFLEIPLSSGETMKFLALSGKMLLDNCRQLNLTMADTKHLQRILQLYENQQLILCQVHSTF